MCSLYVSSCTLAGKGRLLLRDGSGYRSPVSFGGTEWTWNSPVARAAREALVSLASLSVASLPEQGEAPVILLEVREKVFITRRKSPHSALSEQGVCDGEGTKRLARAPSI